MRTKLTAALALSVALLVLAVGAGAAEAGSPVYTFETRASTTQAGGHPDIEIGFEVGNRASQGYNDPCFCNDPKTIEAHLPAGVIGNPHVTPQCTATDFAKFECPIDSQVGIVATLLFNKIGSGYGGQYQWVPLYNMIPHPGQAGLLAFPAPYIENPIYVEISARTGSDYGLDAITEGIERLVPIYGLHQFLWGVPADPIHDEQRFSHGEFVVCGFTDILPYLRENKARFDLCNGQSFNPNPSNSPRLPFMSNPTTCSGPLTSSLDTLSFDHGVATGETTYPAITGCEQLSFNPSQSAQPTTTEADTVSGLDVDLDVPQLQSPTTPSPSQIRAATLTLPDGFTINANAADGKTSCSDVEARFGSEAAAECPEFSKIGTVSIDSSALPGPIPGFVYLGEPEPGDRYRLILTADGYATHIKLAGSIHPNPSTGQLVTEFPNLPQSPLTEFKLHIFGSERGVLATPTQCGTYAVHSTFTPWDASLAEQKATQFFTIDSGPGGSPCPSKPRRFDPSFEAASRGNTAGAFSPFAISVDRHDGDQNLVGLSVTTPPGFSASLRGIPYCSEAAISKLGSNGYAGLLEQASPSCPAASQIGTAGATAGAGSRPLHVDGRVYLAGPYKKAPLSLVVVIPAVSGPYDLGNVVVRAAVHVDPVTAQVTTVSDALPQILDGIPFRTRSIQVDLDRPGFALNPTNCARKAVAATIFGDEGAQAGRGPHYQVANCATLPFDPTLAMRLSGGVNRRGHPAIHAVFHGLLGQSNTHSVSVTLPKGELLDNSHIATVCTRVQFGKDACPEGSQIGVAEANSPLLDGPLSGNVYLRSSDHRLPDLVVDLRGQIDIELSARIDSVGGRLRTSFESVPDVPVSSFVLNLLGGQKGLVTNSEGLCRHVKKQAAATLVGQNGILNSTKVKLSTSCATAKREKRHTRKGKGA